MIRKIFVVMIVGLLVISSQIASAEDYDWSQAKRVGTKAELARYIENERRNGNTTIRVILTNELKTSTEKFYNEFGDKAAKNFINIALVPHVDVDGTHFTDGTVQMTCQITEYPGTRVANAYLSRNREQAWMDLTNEEQKLYNIAVGIVDEANKRNSEVEKARYIHDEICRHVLSYKDENERNKTAIGALIDNYAQCQGFTDAFYMLGRMCGLNVCRINGTLQGEPHAWNFITFSDGKSYCIDVTNGFNTKTTYLFCATKERMEKVGWWCEWSIIPNLQ